MIVEITPEIVQTDTFNKLPRKSHCHFGFSAFDDEFPEVFIQFNILNLQQNDSNTVQNNIVSIFKHYNLKCTRNHDLYKRGIKCKKQIRIS